MSRASYWARAALQVVRPHPLMKRLGGNYEDNQIKDYYGIYQEIPVSDELYRRMACAAERNSAYSSKGKELSPRLTPDGRSGGNAAALYA